MALRDGPPEDPRLRPYHYELPDALIARHPPIERDGGRLLHLGSHGLEDRWVRDLPALLEPGDLVVVNDTRVLSARVSARRQSGGRVEVLLLGGDGDVVEAMVRPGRRLHEGEVLSIDGSPDLSVILEERRTDGTWRVRPMPDPATVMTRVGVVPLPPYLRREAEPEDAVRYQTVFAGPLGAVAAPTAGLHLTADLLAAFQRRRVQVARLTLHVGAGTFRNLRPEDLDAGRLHREVLHVPEATAAAIEAARGRGGRVVAVGTTATRALESRALPGRRVKPGRGHTDLFLRPGAHFGVVDALLTNLHLPGSSLLMLVCAFGGQDRVLSAYQHAVAQRYRFFSYGDAMLLTAPQWETG